MVDRLSWQWIALMCAIPLPVAIAVAAIGWRSSQMILGNIAGATVIFGAALLSIFREYAVLDRLTQECLDAGTTCWPEPTAFTRYAIYAGIGLFQVMALFLFSLRMERRMRERAYAPEWRR
jgi:hypothetical protein